MFSNKTIFAFFLFFVVNIAIAEKLSYRWQNDNLWRLFIEDAQGKNEQYSVELLSLEKDKPVASAGNFQESLMKGIKEANLSTESLPDGLYYFDLKRDDVSVNIARPTPLTWNNEYLTQTVQVDRRNSQLSWQPSVPCLARIIAVLPSGMLVDVVTEWAFYAAKEYALEYNFVGDDGRSIYSQANLSIFAQYIPLPLIFFVQGQPKFADYAASPLFQAIELPRIPLHFELSTNAHLIENDLGIYAGSDATSITVTLDEETAQQLSGKRFEVLIYLDGEFIHEEAQGTSPYTYRLPNFTVTDKPQAISVNVLDYLGNWGIQTLTFQFAQ